MKKDKLINNLVNEVLAPLARILGMYEISDYYNYLPGCDKDSGNYVGGFYYSTFKSIKRNIRESPLLPKALKKELKKLTKEICAFVKSFSGIDALPRRWFSENPNLVFYTASTELYSELKKAGAYDTIREYGFSAMDEMIDRIRSDYLNNTEDYDETQMLLMAYLNLVSDITAPFLDTKQLFAALSPAIRDMNLIPTKDEITEAKNVVNSVSQKDLEKEARKRLHILKDNLGDFNVGSLEALHHDKKLCDLEKEESSYFYHVIYEGNTEYYLSVYPDKFYFTNGRHVHGANCLVSQNGSKEFRYVPLTVKEGQLRIALTHTTKNNI